MRDLSREGAHDIRIRTQAVECCTGLLQKDYAAEACCCLEYCRDEIRYIKDMADAEVLQIPRRTLQMQAGDCDDKSMLLAAMLSSIGHRVRFIAISFVPGQYVHVWVQDNVRGKWLDLEPTEPIPCGERVPHTGVIKTLTCEL
jgi:hypothetical protein